MTDLHLLLTSAVIPGVTLLAWVYLLLRKPSASARIRYLLSFGLIAFGISAVIIAVIIVFVGLEIGFITWGGPDSFWIAALILTGLLSIAASALMAGVNIAVLRFTPSDFSQGD